MAVGPLPKHELKFSVGELEFIEVLQRQFGLSYIAAIDHVVNYKREQVVWYEQQGNHELVKQLKYELGED